jgi:cation transport ATPase
MNLQAVVGYDPLITTPDQIMAAIDDAGFDVTDITKPQQQLATQQKPGLATGFEHNDTGGISQQQQQQHSSSASVSGSGGRGSGSGSGSGACGGRSGRKQLTPQQKEVARWQYRLIISAALSLPVFLWSMATMFNPVVNAVDMSLTVVNSLPVSWLVMLALAGAVQIHSGSVFYAAAYKGLRRGSSNMSLLVALGTTAAFVYSLVSLVMAAVRPSYMGHVYFETSAMILTFICLGKWLEAKAKVRQEQTLNPEA